MPQSFELRFNGKGWLLTPGAFIHVRGDDDGDWGEVTELHDEDCSATFGGESYSILYTDIDNARTPGGMYALVDHPSTPPSVSAPVQPAAPQVAADHLLQNEIAPGSIVTVRTPGTRAWDPNRLFAVLSYTKGTNESQVNVYPVNGDPNFHYKHLRVHKSQCTLVKFTSAIKGQM